MIKIRPLIIKYKMSETRMQVTLKKKQEQILKYRLFKCSIFCLKQLISDTLFFLKAH